MNTLLNWPWITQALIYLGIFMLGHLSGIPTGAWLRGVFSKKILPSMISHRVKHRANKRKKERETAILHARWLSCVNLLKATITRIEAIMTGSEDLNVD